MFEIGENAFEALTSSGEEEFCVRLAAFLRETVVELTEEPPDRTLAAARVLLPRARKYGLISEQSVAAFAVSAAYLGIDFDTEFPAAGLVLNASDMVETEKADWLENWTVALLDALE